MAMKFKAKNMLHSSIFHPTLRQLQQPNIELSSINLMYPLFITDNDESIEPIGSMPDVYRYGISQLFNMLTPLVNNGLKFVLLFGVPENLPKDSLATQADSGVNPVMRALPKLREWFPDLVIACDVCLCPYTNHGHCGILSSDGTLNHTASIERIAQIALSYAKAGAHIVAPSDMNDNRISAIKELLFQNSIHNKVSVLSYSCKFASALYGPFREAAKSAPAFGNRKCYQLPPGSSSLAARAADRDIEEGADMLMVKPGLPYLDIVRQTKDKHPNYPLFIYQVSGEYSMLKKAGETEDIKMILTEVLLSMRRAGADCIITYFTPIILEWLKTERIQF